MDTNLMFTFCSLTVAFVNAVSLSYIRQALRLLNTHFRCGKQKAFDQDVPPSIGHQPRYDLAKDIAPTEEDRI
ncbi:hypothetical protein SAMN05443582_105308 [Phyllobacterium sp. OV277]|jgi:hypothetical protein|nr:hypothetical protein SAMN05443582_105308 [Phyllobacterium sp. OV277]